MVGFPLFQVCEIFFFTWCALLTWQKEVFRSTKAEIAKVRDKLSVLFEHPPSAEVHAARGELMGQLDSLLGREKTYYLTTVASTVVIGWGQEYEVFSFTCVKP